MSHTIQCKVKCDNGDALHSACKILGIAKPVRGRHRLFDGNVVNGLAFRLKDWLYDVVVDSSGTLHYDNYNERWGKTEELDTFLQRYALEAAKAAATSNGYEYDEYTQPDGSIELVCKEVFNG